MIRTTESALKECVTKSMLKSKKLKKYSVKTKWANLTATSLERGKGSMSILLVKRAGLLLRN